MSTPASSPDTPMHLRHQAEIRIKAGTAPRAKVATAGAETLALLHRMASDPGPDAERASTVVKLLHELQVHQVELDLQSEQLEQSRDELSHALDRYVERYDFAPVGYFAVQRDGKIIEGNLAAAELCGVQRDALSGLRIDNLVSSQSRHALLALLKRLGNSDSRETCAVQIDQGGSATRIFQVVATVLPDAQSVMMVFVETTQHKEPGLGT